MIVANNNDVNRHGGNDNDNGGGGIGANDEDSGGIGSSDNKDNKSNNQLKAAEEGRRRQR